MGPSRLAYDARFFEWGIAAIIAPLSVNDAIALNEHHIAELNEHGFIELFKRKAREVAALGMYDEYYKRGWTPHLAKQVKRHLLPIIVQTVALAWYAAAQDATAKPRKQV